MGKVTSGSPPGQVEDPSGHLDDEAVAGPPGCRQAAAHGRARSRAAQRHLALGELHDGSGAQFATPVQGAGESPAVVQRIRGRAALDRRREGCGPVRSQGGSEQRPPDRCRACPLADEGAAGHRETLRVEARGDGPVGHQGGDERGLARREVVPRGGCGVPVGAAHRGGMRDSPGRDARLAAVKCATRGVGRGARRGAGVPGRGHGVIPGRVAAAAIASSSACSCAAGG